jgi:hypothetical protein
MTTRAAMRSTVRTRLGDAGTPALWDDTTLDTAIADALRGYGARVPRERTTDLAVAAGARRIALPPEAVRVLRVVDPGGRTVERWPAVEPPGGAAGQAWRAWDGGVALAEPAQGGTWQVDSFGPRSLPADDAAELDIAAGDEAAVALLAAAFALERRAADEAKRGLAPVRGGIAGLAGEARAAAERALGARRRRARLG